jgi:hypothetical protein
MVNSYLDDSTRQALIAQHTLLPQDFVDDSAQLNELGARDLSILAAHFKTCPGTLNVRRGQVSGELYKARIASVRDALAHAGVPVARLAITDGFAGGDGMTSDHVVFILSQENQTETATPGAGGSYGPTPGGTNSMQGSSNQGNQP